MGAGAREQCSFPRSPHGPNMCPHLQRLLFRLVHKHLLCCSCPPLLPTSKTLFPTFPTLFLTCALISSVSSPSLYTNTYPALLTSTPFLTPSPHCPLFSPFLTPSPHCLLPAPSSPGSPLQACTPTQTHSASDPQPEGSRPCTQQTADTCVERRHSVSAQLQLRSSKTDMALAG